MGLSRLSLLSSLVVKKKASSSSVSRTITCGSIFSLKEPIEAGDRAVEGNVDGVLDLEKVDGREVRLLTVGNKR